MMNCISTRGRSPSVLPGQALLLGAASDGGLFLPDSLPKLDSLMNQHGDYQTLAEQVFSLFLPDLDREDLRQAALNAYREFESVGVAPLVKLGEDFVLELFHGPTAAFKDLALQALPHLMSLAKQQYGPDTDYTVLTATSGDTGSAAMAGFKKAPGFRALVYYPLDGISPVQQMQMLSLRGSQAQAVAIRGNFDDAQAGVKAAFAALQNAMPPGQRLSSANSINLGRLIAQMVYYIKACGELKAQGALKERQAVDFVVPSGNFGNILAGYLVKRMGLPVGQLVCVTNANTVLADFLRTGVYDRRRMLVKTQSPSMDILVSSNLERLLYYAADQDTGKVASLMKDLNEQGFYQVDEDIKNHIRQHFVGIAGDDTMGRKAIKDVYDQHHYLLDPHTALAHAALKQLPNRQNLRVVVATASPFKFPDAIAQALDVKGMNTSLDPLQALADAANITMPPSLQGMMSKAAEDYEVIDKEELVNDVKRRMSAW